MTSYLTGTRDGEWTWIWADLCSLIAWAPCSFNWKFFLEISLAAVFSTWTRWSRASLIHISLWRSRASEWRALASLWGARCWAVISSPARVGSKPWFTTATWAVLWSMFVMLIVFSWLYCISISRTPGTVRRGSVLEHGSEASQYSSCVLQLWGHQSELPPLPEQRLSMLTRPWRSRPGRATLGEWHGDESERVTTR